MKTIPKPTCPDCGPAPVNHTFYYVIAIMDWLLSPVVACCIFLESLAAPITQKFKTASGLFFIKLALALHLGTLTTSLDEKDNLRTQALWESAKKLGIDMKEFRFFGLADTNFFIAQYKNKNGNKDEIIFFDGLPLPRGASTKSLSWLDDKSIMQKRFRKAQIPVPQGGVALTFSQAEKIFSEINGPVIVKPRIGSRSRHTHIHIISLEQLISAFKSAQRLSPWVLVQQELVGRVYRGTVIGGKVVGVIRRDPAHVIGDGVSTISELVEKENKNPKRSGLIFCPMLLDRDAEKQLQFQQLTYESIPQQDQFVELNPKVSRGCGASTTDVTDQTHPDTITLLEDAAHVLNSSLVGIDFIIKDITQSWKDQKNSGIIECNSLPYIDLHHYPLYGESRDVAGILWHQVFPIYPPTSI